MKGVVKTLEEITGMSLNRGIPLSETSPKATPSKKNNISSKKGISSPEIIPEAILAFRTITTMLAVVQEGTTFSDSKKSPLPEQRQELEILNALSTVIVRDVEVVAVIVKDRSTEQLEVIACTHLAAPEKKLTTPQSNTTTISDYFWKFLVTANPRRDKVLSDTPAPTDVPTISDPKAPDLKGNDSWKYIEDHWSDEQPLDLHLWFLCEFLIQSKVDMKPLQLYVIAACFLKMRRRMNDKNNISKFYYDSLTTLDVSEFPEFIEPPPSGTFKTTIDKQLLIEVLPVLHEHLPHLPMSNLLRQAEAANSQCPYNIYTEDTRIEFHALLCGLLKCYKESLDSLKTYHQQRNRLSTASKFKSHLSTVLIYGTALQLLSRGSAINNHLKAIESLLRDHRRDKTADVKLQMAEEIEEEVEVDAELEGTTEQPLWESYRDWLRLMVAHFEAVSVLVGHIASSKFQSDKIVIKILSAPRPNQAMLPWEDLLNSKYFPAHTLNSAPNASIENIIDSLKMWSKPEGNNTNNVENVLLAIQKLLTRDSEEPSKLIVAPSDEPANASAVGLSPELEQIIIQLKSLKDCQSPARDKCIAEIIATLSNLPSRAPQSQELIRGVVHMLESLRDGAIIFRQLRKNALKKGIGFIGSLHCELIIASLIELAASSRDSAIALGDILKEFENSGHVIGVSKRCCPVCQQLLNILTTGKQFVVRGSHTKISPCTLPTWLPENIVNSMNIIFGSQLRGELCELIERKSVVRKRSLSLESQRLSIDSTRSDINISMVGGFKETAKSAFQKDPTT